MKKILLWRWLPVCILVVLASINVLAALDISLKRDERERIRYYEVSYSFMRGDTVTLAYDRVIKWSGAISYDDLMEKIKYAAKNKGSDYSINGIKEISNLEYRIDTTKIVCSPIKKVDNDKGI